MKNGAFQRVRDRGMELWKSGLTDRAIARMLHCSRNSVRHWRARNGLPPNTWCEKMDLLHERAKPLYDDGLNDMQIAARFGVSKNRVQDWRKGKGLPANCATGSEDWYACLQNVDRDAMLMRLHENGLTDRQAAVAMRVSVSAAKCRRLRLGLPCNSELKARSLFNDEAT